MPRILTILMVLILLVVSAESALAQKTIRGRVSDAESGVPVPYVSIRIEGLLSGTVANQDGEYELRLEELPAEIGIGSIGYYSARFLITADTPDTFDIALKQNPVVLEEIVVTLEDPAVRIMREVIRRKQVWRKNLADYQVEGYTRTTLSNEKGIVSISESISDVFWNPKRGTRETIRSHRQTRNLGEEANMASSARMVPNLYDDTIEIIGFDMIGPTHPRALDYYTFTLTGGRSQDGLTVYDIDVKPKSRLQPAFVGHLSVLDSAYAMISISVTPNEVVTLPSPLNNFHIALEQQFASFGGDWWLPCDVRVDADLKLKLPGLAFPVIRYHQLTLLTDYRVNTAADSAFEEPPRGSITIGISNRGTTVDIESGTDVEPVAAADSVAQATVDSIFTAASATVPMTAEEEAAYATIDSTDTLGEAFRPTGALTALFREGNRRPKPSEPSAFRKAVGKAIDPFHPTFSFNRVDGAAAGLTFKNTLYERLLLEVGGAYRQEPDDWAYRGSARYGFGGNRHGFVAASFDQGTASRFTSSHYPGWLNTLGTLAGRDDYFDFYDRQAARIAGGFRFGSGIEITGALNAERHRSLEKTTDKNLLGHDIDRRFNPPVEEGLIRSLEIGLAQGEGPAAFGMAGGNRGAITIEYSPADFLGSDFSFTRYEVMIDRRVETFLKRRLFPMTLDVRLATGFATIGAPIQRWGGFDGAYSVFSQPGTFRTLRDQPVQDRWHTALFWEHNFRTVPFELAHFDWAVKKNIGIILYGAGAITSWESNSELGVSLNGLGSLFRVDLTRSLDQGIWCAGFGLARIF